MPHLRKSHLLPLIQRRTARRLRMMSMRAGGRERGLGRAGGGEGVGRFSEAMTAKAIQDFRKRIQGTMGPRFRGDDTMAVCGRAGPGTMPEWRITRQLLNEREQIPLLN
jgi:hypothetical protein